MFQWSIPPSRNGSRLSASDWLLVRISARSEANAEIRLRWVLENVAVTKRSFIVPVSLGVIGVFFFSFLDKYILKVQLSSWILRLPKYSYTLTNNRLGCSIRVEQLRQDSSAASLVLCLYKLYLSTCKSVEELPFSYVQQRLMIDRDKRTWTKYNLRLWNFSNFPFFHWTQHNTRVLNNFFNFSTLRLTEFSQLVKVERGSRRRWLRDRRGFLANVQGNPVETGSLKTDGHCFWRHAAAETLADVRSACWTPVPLSFSFRVRVALRRAVDRTSRLRHRSIERDREIKLETQVTWNTMWNTFLSTLTSSLGFYLRPWIKELECTSCHSIAQLVPSGRVN